MLDDFIMQHPLGGGIAGAGAGPEEQDGTVFRVRTRTEAHPDTAVGDTGGMSGRTHGKATLGPTTTPMPHPVRLMTPPNSLPRRRD